MSVSTQITKQFKTETHACTINFSSKMSSIVVVVFIILKNFSEKKKNDGTVDSFICSKVLTDTLVTIPTFPMYHAFLADRFAICLFCRNSIKCETSSVKCDLPLSEVLLPITIMDLIGNWKFKYSHASHLAPYMVVT